jgi:hypothetical protein
MEAEAAKAAAQSHWGYGFDHRLADHRQPAPILGAIADSTGQTGLGLGRFAPHIRSLGAVVRRNRAAK